MDDMKVAVSVHFGTVEIVPCYKLDDEGWLHCGGLSIKRDSGGCEIERTEPSFTSRCRFDPPKTLWQKITKWMS